MVRPLLRLLPLLLLSACGLGDFSGPPTRNPTLTTEARAVNQSLDEISTVFDGAESEDLTMAWTDLDADLRSVVQDLVRDPTSVDMVGMQARVEGFITRFQTTAEMSRINGHWEDLLTRLSKLADGSTSPATP